MYRKILSILAISIIAVANSSETKKFGLPPLRNVPAISEIRKPVPEDRPIKVAVTCFLPGSNLKNQMDTAKGLSKAKDSEGNPLYNVTLIVQQDKEVKTSDTLHAFRIPITLAEIETPVEVTIDKIFSTVVGL